MMLKMKNIFDRNNKQKNKFLCGIVTEYRDYFVCVCGAMGNDAMNISDLCFAVRCTRIYDNLFLLSVARLVFARISSIFAA